MGLVVRRDQGFDLPAQVWLGADLRDISGFFLRRPLEGVAQHFLDFPPAFRRHLVASLLFISRCSQARAMAQSRFKVAGEMPSTIDASSMESPPKNRNSTRRPCGGSKAASWFNASSSAIKSTSRFCDRAIWASSVRRGAPAPPLSR